MATALTGPAPCPLTANCLRCGRITYAPVPVRWVENAVRYACPQCAPLTPPGPTPGEHGPAAVVGPVLPDTA
ncbi:hypothetical protein ACWD4V_04215 [Streptomyces tsukubensis]|uniref:hypothetical protein n=1 Tax=Streptomyces tsukubensis TaxID=83656 RepID=UPI0036BF1D99